LAASQSRLVRSCHSASGQDRPVGRGRKGANSQPAARTDGGILVPIASCTQRVGIRRRAAFPGFPQVRAEIGAPAQHTWFDTYPGLPATRFINISPTADRPGLNPAVTGGTPVKARARSRICRHRVLLLNLVPHLKAHRIGRQRPDPDYRDFRHGATTNRLHVSMISGGSTD
jgi:hypothetical protein